MKYCINYGTGAGNEYVNGMLKDAKTVADKGSAYTQMPIKIENESGSVVCTRPWCGTEYDADEDESENPICLGNFGYYGDWCNA